MWLDKGMSLDKGRQMRRQWQSNGHPNMNRPGRSLFAQGAMTTIVYYR
jgi:hypothetical protein